MTDEVALRCVVDASVAIKLFVNEPWSNEAHALFNHLAADPLARFYVPDLFYVECANILWKYVRRFGLPSEAAHDNLVQLSELMLQSIPTFDLMIDALDLAVTYAISSYDGCYVALARRLKLPLVTADEKLARTLSRTSSDIHWLATFPMPP